MEILSICTNAERSHPDQTAGSSITSPLVFVYSDQLFVISIPAINTFMTDSGYQCDQAQPSCGQCAKSEKECPGYRNLLDLSFRNESSSIIEKVNARYRRTSTKPKEARSVDLKEGNNPRPRPLIYYWDVTTSPSPSPSPGLAGFSFADYLQLRKDGYSSTVEALSTFSMYPTLEERGMSYFASNFITAPCGPTHGSFVGSAIWGRTSLVLQAVSQIKS